jgi:ABC-type multidrug transport system fused ATPase/permease subunit
VLDQGRIVEEGSYDNLVANQGPFYELTQRQIV